MRWDNGCYAVFYELDGARHGARYRTLDEAVAHFNRIPSSQNAGSQLMTALTFRHADLARLLAEAESHWPRGIRQRYCTADPAGFWLVGDEGVYLMHNGVVGEENASVVYAVECNPKTMALDDWWNVERATFGPDDGVDFIEAPHIRHAAATGADLVISMSPDSFEISYAPPLARAKS